MIEIVAKDYSHFFNILNEYNIPETEALFIPWKNVSSLPIPKSAPYKKEQIVGCSDWMDYSSFN